jgi:hypothetical protein
LLWRAQPLAVSAGDSLKDRQPINAPARSMIYQFWHLCPRRQCLYWLTRKSNDRKDSKNSSERNEEAFNAGHHERKGVALATGEALATLDFILNYTFNLSVPAGPGQVPGYAKDNGKNLKPNNEKGSKATPVSTAEYNPSGWRA